MHEQLLFLERTGDQVAVKEWSGPNKVRTVRTMPLSVLDRSNIAVHGNNVAWQQVRGDSIDLMIAAGVSEPRRLLSYANVNNNEISFSHDGQLLVLHYATSSKPSDLMAIVDVAGRSEPRIIDTGSSYWYWPRWLPDNSAVVVVGGGAGSEAEIVSVPTQPGAKLRSLTANDPGSKWGFELSPDGRTIAYPREIWKGSRVWKIELGM